MLFMVMSTVTSSSEFPATGCTWISFTAKGSALRVMVLSFEMLLLTTLTVRLMVPLPTG